jgi:hypothetical protein
MHNIKYKRVKKLSVWGKYHKTFDHIWSLIPEYVKVKLTSKELADLIENYHQKVFELGKSTERVEILFNGFLCSSNNIYNLVKQDTREVQHA